MTQLYATDLDPEKRNDDFMGEGFEALLKEAEENDQQLVIGEFCKNTDWYLE